MLADAEAALGSRQLGRLLPCQYDEHTPSVALWSTELMERVADDAMALSGAFGMLGLLVGMVAAVALRIGLRALREPEPNRGRWQINAPAADADELPAAPVVPEMAPQPEPELEPEPEPEPELYRYTTVEQVQLSGVAQSAASSADGA